jgi:hypothetical protein
MFLNYPYLIIFVVITVIVLGLFIYTLYCFFSTKSLSFHHFKSNSQLNNLQKSLIAGAIVPYGNDEATTVVELTDAELNELLQIVFAEIGNSNIIEIQLLQSLGLYTDTVVSLLQALGFIIF